MKNEDEMKDKDDAEDSMERREELSNLMRECIDDARAIVQEKRLLESQEVLSGIAIALFEARVSSRFKKK